MSGMPHDVPQLPEALESWRVHSNRFVSWALFHDDEFKGMQTSPEEYHQELRVIAQGMAIWNGSGSLKDHLIDHAPGEPLHIARLMEDLPVKPGAELLACMRRARARVELRRAIMTGDYRTIQAATDRFRAIEENVSNPWTTAREVFPRVPVPWDFLAISDSIQQLARAGAVTSAPLPGAVLAILAGIIGRSADISPKPGWREPFILWHADIRESGDGKTHPARMLIRSMYEWQKGEDDRYRREQEAYDALTKKEKQGIDPPTPARSYFGTDITLEGLRSALDGHPTGGMIILLDELSSFFSGQNQYKNGKGSDRESWLCLHDGNPARVIRAGKSCYIYGGRVQLYGGIQPAVLRQSITAKNGIYMDDGTVFRFLFSFSRSSFQELTGESWSHDNQEEWTSILSAAREWASQHTGDTWHMALDRETREYFFEWRNDLYGLRDSLPQELRGFIPKAVGYALRLTGIIHALNRFAQGQEPLASLGREDLDAGIAFALFYLGQTVDAVYYLIGKDQGKPAIDMTDTRVIALAQALGKVEPDVEAGRVSVGHVHRTYNELVSDSEKFRSSRAVGAFLRSLGLTIPPRRFSWRGQCGVYCLSWDGSVKKLLKQCS